MRTIYLENERIEVADPSDIDDLQFQINQLKDEIECIKATLQRAENAAIKRAYNPAASGRSDRL